MMANPFDRPLTDAERDLMAALAIRVLADQLEGDAEDARNALKRLAAERKVAFRGDAEDVYLELAPDRLLVHAKRDWLAFHAANPGYDPMRDEKRSQH
jgi:hypothetical protein